MAAKPSLDPVSWTPPVDRGLTGGFAVTAPGAPVERWDVPGVGPEDVAVDGSGAVYTGTNDGWVLRLTDGGRSITRIVNTGGRPGGIEVDADGSLVVCDMYRGLLRVDTESGAVTTLVAADGPVSLTFTNNCDVAADGSVYFTDSSDKYQVHNFKGDLLEGVPRGRLLRWSPDGSVDVVVSGLRFANGVGLAADDSYALVAETGGYCLTKVWLNGERAGQRETLVDNLPGIPDNIGAGSDGVFWVAMPSERNALLDRLLPRPGVLRKAIWALPERLQPDANHVVFVLGIDGDGRVRHVVHSPGETYHYVTGVREHDGWLYLGSLAESTVARIPLPR